MKPIQKKQEPPFTIKIEMTEGCNLYCDFCGLQSIREQPGNFKFMTTHMAEDIAESIRETGWNSRIEFSLHGEPTMNPNYVDIIRIMREYLPKQNIMMTTNGGGFLRSPGPTENIANVFEAGLNAIAFDAYEDAAIYRKFVERYDPTEYPMRVYPDDPGANPYRRLKRNERLLCIFPDIRNTESGVHAKIHNTAGCSGPKDHAYNNKRCARPFRELCISQDGKVVLCCNDWRRTYRCGSAVTWSLESIWQGAAFTAARQKLLHYDREFGPCDGCSSVSYRVGLLPDKKGTYTLPIPDRKTEENIRIALSRGPLTMPVKRSWEKKK